MPWLTSMDPLMEQTDAASLDRSAIVFGGHCAIKSDSAQAVAFAVPALAPASELPQPLT